MLTYNSLARLDFGPLASQSKSLLRDSERFKRKLQLRYCLSLSLSLTEHCSDHIPGR